MNWAVYALLSALFAGATAILAKIGIENIPSNLATFVRTGVILVFAAGIVLAQGQIKLLSTFSSRNWLFLVLSGVATGLSWLFYFAAIKNGPVSHVAPIDKLSFVIAMLLAFFFLQERVNRMTWVGACLILAGVLLTLPSVQAFLLERFGMR